MDTGEFVIHNKNKKDGKLSTKLKNSIIIGALIKFAKLIYDKVFVSIFCLVLTSYDQIEQHFQRSKSATLINTGTPKTQAHTRNIKNAFSKQIEQSVLINFVKRVLNGFANTNLTSYGVFLFSFGIYVLAECAVKYFALDYPIPETSTLIIGIASIVVSLFLLPTKKSLAQTMNDSIILNYVLFEVLGFSKPKTDPDKAPGQHSAAGFIFGMILGIACFWFSPISLVKILLFAGLVLLILGSPEAGTVAMFFCVPFVPTMYLAGLIIIVFFSFMIKFLCGRRVIKLSPIDFPILIFGIMILSGGFISFDSKGSLKRALLYFCFIVGYFLVKWMFRSPTFINRSFSALSLSLAIVSLIGIAEFFFGSPSDTWQDHTLFAGLKGRVVSTFENPNMLAEFLILLIPVSLAVFITSKNNFDKILHLVSTLLGLCCLVLTWSRGAWLGIIIATAVTLLIASRYWFTTSILLLPIGAAGVICIDNSITQRFTSIINLTDSTTSYRIGIWKSTINMLKDHFLCGIGVGEGAFNAVFPFYAASGITKALHSHSLYLQIITETGIFSLLIFAVIIFILAQSVLSYAKNAVSHSNRIRVLGLGCGIGAFLLMGFTDYVWYNYKIFLLFWMIIGIISAQLTYSRESPEENRITY